MIDALFSQTNYVGAKKMLDGTVLRQQAIGQNLANLETPHYQRVDLSPSFQTDLQHAMGDRSLSEIKAVQPKIMADANAISSSRDGNTVRLENELIQMNQNTLQHTLETQLVTGALLKLRLAITGRAS